MRKPTLQELRKHWLAISLLILVLYLIFPVNYEEYWSFTPPLASRLELATYVLSFPLGTFCAFFLGAGWYITGEQFPFCATALAVGYLQWFHLVPALFSLRKPLVTTLNLNPADTVALPAPTPAPTPAPRLADKQPAPVPSFDERGHTPLERAMLNDE